MSKETTNTSAYELPLARFYDIATVEEVKKKKIKEIYTIYEWSFSTTIDNEVYTFKISLFPSQMEELLRALGAKEIGKNKFEWDTELVVGSNLSFVLSHQEDKSGTMRAVLSDIKPATASVNPGGVTKADQVEWSE